MWQSVLPPSDVAILNIALTPEYLQAAFSPGGVAKGGSTVKVGQLTGAVKDHEVARVVYLRTPSARLP